MKDIVEKLRKLNKTIATMESCTGGYLASTITNVINSGDVFKFGAVTYSNNYKIKMGVDAKLIEKYSVYSMEFARNMACTIAKFTNSNYGVGITGKLNHYDKKNQVGDNSTVFISIYNADNNKYIDKEIKVSGKTRIQSKKQVIMAVEKILKYEL